MRRAVLTVLMAAAVGATAAFADPLDPQVSINARDQASARGAILGRADLGAGWVGGARGNPSFKSPSCPAFQPKRNDLTITGHAESVFNNGNRGIQVDSDVEILKSAAEVRTQFGRLFQPPLTGCIRYDILKSVGGSGVRIGPATRMTFPKLTPIVAAYHVVLSVPSGGKTVQVFDDTVMLAQSRTEYFLNFIAPAAAASQLTAFELRVARLLVKRATA